jgi:hypothetical protein
MPLRQRLTLIPCYQICAIMNPEIHRRIYKTPLFRIIVNPNKLAHIFVNFSPNLVPRSNYLNITPTGVITD